MRFLPFIVLYIAFVVMTWQVVRVITIEDITGDCDRLGAFEVNRKFYSCELVEKNYIESEDFK